MMLSPLWRGEERRGEERRGEDTSQVDAQMGVWWTGMRAREWGSETRLPGVSYLAACSNSQKLVMPYGGTWDTIYCGALMFIYSFTIV
jgi:hypothetical protein